MGSTTAGSVARWQEGEDDEEGSYGFRSEVIVKGTTYGDGPMSRRRCPFLWLPDLGGTLGWLWAWGCGGRDASRGHEEAGT